MCAVEIGKLFVDVHTDGPMDTDTSFIRSIREVDLKTEVMKASL